MSRMSRMSRMFVKLKNIVLNGTLMSPESDILLSKMRITGVQNGLVQCRPCRTEDRNSSREARALQRNGSAQGYPK